MRFRVNENFRKFVKLAGVEVTNEKEFSKGLCAALVDAGLLKDEDDSYGEHICDLLFNTQVYKVAEAVERYIGKSLNMDALLAFDDLQVIEEFNCPYCGRSLDYYPSINGYDRDGSPRENGSFFSCKCGFRASIEDKLDSWNADIDAEEAVEYFIHASYEHPCDETYMYNSLKDLR